MTNPTGDALAAGRLRRSVETWRNMVPKAVADGSPAQVIDDARADILTLAGAVARLRAENDTLSDENSDLRNEPWPEWATKVISVIRERSGYDGYDDATEGVDLPAELDDCLSEIEAENAKLRDDLASLLRRWMNSGCPVCSGDCSAANPPVMSCLMRDTLAVLAR